MCNKLSFVERNRRTPTDHPSAVWYIPSRGGDAPPSRNNDIITHPAMAVATTRPALRLLFLSRVIASWTLCTCTRGRPRLLRRWPLSAEVSVFLLVWVDSLCASTFGLICGNGDGIGHLLLYTLVIRFVIILWIMYTRVYWGSCEGASFAYSLREIMYI